MVIQTTETIIATCTASGRGALALVRLDGVGAFEIAVQMARTKRANAILDAASHTIVYGHVVDQEGKAIDQVLFLLMRAPRTFTGNDIVEITCHNNPFVIEEIIARACALGARGARPGEFTQRALMNGKMDAIQAEALHELIMAPSRAVAHASLAQLEGSLSRQVALIEEQLVTLAALAEASFEFSESESLDVNFNGVMRTTIAQTLEFMDQVLAGQSVIQQLREGVKIALVGTVNAGKSTLLNALVGRNRAIVSSMPGTTRDSIEAGVSECGYSWTYIDTAGLRVTEDAIEREGIERSYGAAQGADFILLVVDGSARPTPEVAASYQEVIARYSGKIMLVFTKADQGTMLNWFTSLGKRDYLTVSVHQNNGVENLKHEILRRVKALYEKVDTPFVLSKRQVALVSDVRARLIAIQQACKAPSPAYELVSIHIQDALALISELVGRSVTERVMDSLFSSFCIGK